MREMKPFSIALKGALKQQASKNELAAKAARASQVKTMWKAAVEAVCGPGAAYILDKTNSVYIIRKKRKDEQPDTGVARETLRRNSANGDIDEKMLIVYVEDSLTAAEVDARREMIRLKLFELFGENVGSFWIRVSRSRYKLFHPYREEKQEDAPAAESLTRAPLTDKQRAVIEEKLSAVSDERVRKSLKRAVISDLEIKNGSRAEKGKN